MPSLLCCFEPDSVWAQYDVQLEFDNIYWLVISTWVLLPNFSHYIFCTGLYFRIYGKGVWLYWQRLSVSESIWYRGRLCSVATPHPGVSGKQAYTHNFVRAAEISILRHLQLYYCCLAVDRLMLAVITSVIDSTSNPSNTHVNWSNTFLMVIFLYFL